MRLFRRRKHAVRRNAAGQSCRQRAFECFARGERPSQVYKSIGIPARTAYRYFESFKKLKNQVPYSIVRQWLRDNPDFSEQAIALLTKSLDMPPQEVVVRLGRPWGLLKAMRGDWPNYRLERRQTVLEQRLAAALTVVQFCEIFGQRDPNFVKETLQQIIIDKGEELPEA